MVEICERLCGESALEANVKAGALGSPAEMSKESASGVVIGLLAAIEIATVAEVAYGYECYYF